MGAELGELTCLELSDKQGASLVARPALGGKAPGPNGYPGSLVFCRSVCDERSLLPMARRGLFLIPFSVWL